MEGKSSGGGDGVVTDSPSVGWSEMRATEYVDNEPGDSRQLAGSMGVTAVTAELALPVVLVRPLLAFPTLFPSFVPLIPSFLL